MTFCSECGAHLDPDALFCENCGNRRTDAAKQEENNSSPPSPSGIDDGNTSRVIIPLIREKKSFFNEIDYFLIIDSESLIFAFCPEEYALTIDGQIEEEHDQVYPHQNPDEHDVIRQILSKPWPWKEYNSMTIERILAESGDNFSLPLQEIKNLTINLADTGIDTLKISTMNNEYSFEIFWRTGHIIHSALAGRMEGRIILGTSR